MATTNENPIKIILVKNCLGCPYSDIRYLDDCGGELWCGDKKFIGKMVDVCSPDFDDKIFRERDLTDISDFGVEVENMLRYCYG